MAEKQGADLIIDQFLEDYSRRRKIEEQHKPRLFAQCAIDTLVLRSAKNEYDARDIFVDGQNDVGLDGIAIVVNDQVIKSFEDIERIITEDRELRAQFIFVQATMDREFRAQKMSSFASGVWRFFQSKIHGPINSHIRKVFELKQTLLKRAEWMRSCRPVLQLYYVSTGQWVGDNVLEGEVASAEDLLESTGLFFRG